MKYQLDFKLILSSAAIAILAAGCQFSSPGGAVSQNNPTQDATDTSAPTTEVAQPTEKSSDLNLTDAQKAQMKQIREQTKTKIAALLSPDQQTQFKAASEGSHKSPMKVLRSLNLSKEQKQQVREIMSSQRQQMQAILTPEQQAKMKEHRGSKEQPSS